MLLDAYVPAMQAVQAVLPLPAVNCPGAQLLQLELFASAANVPGPHSAQLVALPPADQEPGAQAPQVLPLTKKPGSQRTGEQANEPLGDVCPHGHAVQLCSPVSLAYVFAGHCSQLSMADRGAT